jgi:eukaryotic-like serine/threonine-protein kinase
MEPFEDERVLRAAEAIADGRSFSWDPIDASLQDEESVAFLRELKFLERLASVHRAGETPMLASSSGGVLDPMRESPRQWGAFRILTELGRGTFGVVYRARDIRLDRDVALKLFSPRHGSTSDDLTVVTEGRLLAKVTHPNVITVYGADIVDGTVGIWMELSNGRTLQQELADRGPLGAAEAALIGIDLCRALAAVHQKKLVHRDVKAQNVMREDGGRIVLMDFGAGRDLQAATGPVSAAGTPLYMAPEVLAGAPATAGSDLYSLGVLLYRLVTNDFPVSARTLEELERAHATGERRRLRDVRPDLPATFIKAVESATASAPADRPASAAALEEQLERVLLSGDADHRRSSSQPETDERRRFRRLTRRGVVAALLVLSIAVAWKGAAIRNPFAPPSASIESLAVLPFANLTGGPDQDYLADGFTELLIGNLTRLKSLRVISRTSAMQYKGQNRPLAEIARELNVDGIVEGSVTRSGDRLRVTVQLLRANEDHVWGQTYERPAADMFKVQGEISSTIADAVRLTLTPTERMTIATAPGMQVQAQEAFLRGLHRMSDLRSESLKLALVDLLEAVRLDPSSARAYATLSQCYLYLATREVVSSDTAYREALTAATRAMQLDDTVAEAHTQLAEVKFYYEWNWEWARSEYERALELNPNNSHAVARYALFLSALGREEEALRWATLAQQLDPRSSSVRFAPAMALFYAGRFDESIAAFQHLKSLPPYNLYPTDRVGLARALAARGRFDEALAEIGLAIEKQGPLAPWRAEQARIHAVKGDRAKAREIVKELESRNGGDLIPAPLAFAYIGLGEKDAAFEALSRAAERRAPALLWLNVDPRFDPVRDDARFHELIVRVGLTPH